MASAFQSFFDTIYTELLGFVTPLAIIGLIVCGLMFVFSSDEKTAAGAKKWAIRIAVGIVIAYGAKYMVALLVNAAKQLPSKPA